MSLLRRRSSGYRRAMNRRKPLKQPIKDLIAVRASLLGHDLGLSQVIE